MRKERIVPYLARLYGYAYSLCVDRETARDLVQDCAVRALQARTTPRDETAFRSWLFKILRNLHIDHRRRAIGADRVFDAEDLTAIPDVEDFDLRMINAISVRQGLERLPPVHREIIGLIDLAGFNYSEAAAILDIPPGTVMSRISRARRGLLAAMQESNIRVVTPRVRESSK